MKLDEVQRILGEFGTYQRRMYAAICLPVTFLAIQCMSSIFILGIPKHRCAIPGLLNDTYEVQNSQHARLIDLFIPRSSEGYSSCDIYDIRSPTTLPIYDTEPADNATTTNHSGKASTLNKTRCQRWVYDKSVFYDTIVTETDLVCSKSMYRAHATTAYFVGGLAGFLVVGPVADRFGRKNVTYFLLICMFLSSLLLLWVPSIFATIVFRFINGFGCLFTPFFVYVMEFIGPSKRGSLGLMTNSFWGIGVVIQSGIAYGIRSWRYLQLAFSLPIITFIAYFWLLPESPRWLFAKGHIKRGNAVIEDIAKVNGIELDLDNLKIDVSDDQPRSNWRNLVVVFKHRILAVRCVVVFWNRFVVGLLFYGLVLNIPNLSGDLYVNFCLSGVMEILGYSLVIPLMNWLGRKRSYVIMMCAGGGCMLMTLIPRLIGNETYMWTVTVLSMSGKLTVSAAYAVNFVHASELFPTVIRSTVMTNCANMSYLGIIVSPYLVELATVLRGPFATEVPILVFGTLGLSAGLVYLVLPETAGRNMPDNIQDILTQE